ncbi:ABC transporter ATP-binding protein [Microbacterium candidum]|uniref:ABC transporter ATP-binding protein n=1 Tax=Microbacterium candidum TaxID=3041922 RepID=A0ABT7MWD8_9MICO|nr:ABC transporter ATP-binding protein [Microbacterium sp. ASV49]MDL9978771.1 ABC transporter ATP-binding protein [Microbacterium sp. ASV49]
MAPEPLLTLSGVTAGYGAGLILKGVDLEVEAGKVVCLIGPNGAGKSTVLKTISGLLRPKSGTVRFRGEEIGQLRPRERLLRGVVHVPQDRSLFPEMTVWENLIMGAFSLSDGAVVKQRAEAIAEDFPIVTSRRNAQAGSLSGGEQKQVELARSLMLDPALILLDEPSIGLDPKSRVSVFESIRTLADGGRTVLLVEQNARSGLQAADKGVVLEAGRVALTGTGDALLNDPEVARLYLGAASHVSLEQVEVADGAA